MKRYRYYLVILLLAGLFVLPQLWSQKMILGADALFHYNRFYETAEQIRTGTFSYFISLFGFQKSGRIVNAVYGPLFSYLQGGLVLAAGSWFRYQVLSNFIVYSLAGCSLFKLLTYDRIKERTALFTAIIFMTTYSINYWVLNQGFTSWGTSLLPLCLIPLVDLKNQRFPIIKIAVSMAVMTQIHMLTAVMLSLTYFPFFIAYARRRWGTALKQLIKAFVLYVSLSMNVWSSLFLINTGDQLKMPFVNSQMSEKGIDQGGAYWLQYPRILTLLLLVGMIFCLIYWHEIRHFTKQLLIFSGIFLLFSTSIIPWDWLVAHQVPMVSLIQFPFRFFAPFTVLFLFFFASLVTDLNGNRVLSGILIVLSVVGAAQNVQVLTHDLSQWDRLPLESKHTFVQVSETQARASFFSDDLQKALEAVEKSSPDYLPVYHNNEKNKYISYEQQIIAPQTKFSKSVKNRQLEISWQAKNAGDTQLPIVLYQNSKLIQGNQVIKPSQLSDIGAPTIKQKVGENSIRLRYDPPSYLAVIFSLCGFSWTLVMVWLLLNKVNFGFLVDNQVKYK